MTGIVGIYIDDKTFELRNEQKSIEYFDSVDDIALWTFKEVHTEDIRSFFEDTDQIDTPVNEIDEENHFSKMSFEKAENF